MNRFTIDFDGKKYSAVEMNGECVDLDTIILAESALDNAVMKYMDDTNTYNAMYSRAIEIDETIFGYGSKELITNGSEEDLKKYAVSLL